MANVALFIRIETLKAETVLNNNVDEGALRAITMDAQDMYIKPVLGSTLYETMATEINAGSLSAVNTTLLNSYIKPALKHWILAEASMFLIYQYRNKGIEVRNSEQSNAAGVKEWQMLEDRCRQKANWFTEQLKTYLIQNEASYPDYQNPSTNIDKMQPNKNVSNNTGIYLGGRGNRRCWGRDPNASIDL